MNRIAIRFTLAMLVVMFVTVVVQLSVIGYVLYALLARLPEASLKKLETIFPETYSPSFQNVELYILAGAEFMVIVVGVILALVVARRVTRPLEVVSHTASKVAKGDLGARATLGRRVRRGGDEAGMLVQNFNAMADSLEKLEGERKATSAAIAHELRTPITILRGRLEAIRDGVVRLDDAEFSNLLSQTEVLSRLVSDLRTLSLADAGQLSLERYSVDLRNLVGQVVSSFEARAGSKGMRLEFACDLERLEAPVDANRIHQVIGNLIENAVRYAPEGGFVRVGLEASTDHAIITVRDSGEGIAPMQLEKVFDRFYRTDQSRSRFTGGSGLGLAIVRALVELHGGQISVRNHPEGGAEFMVRLPRTLGVAPKAPKRAWSLEWARPSRPSKRRAEPIASTQTPELYESSTFANFLYLLLAFPLGLSYFILLVVGLAFSVPLSILVIGLPFLAFTLVASGWMAALERWLNDILLGIPVPFVPRPIEARGFRGWLRSIRNAAAWRTVVYLCLKFPFGLASFAAGVILSVVSVGFLLSPIFYLIDPQMIDFDFGPVFTLEGGKLETALILSVIGLILGIITVVLMNWIAHGWGHFARAMLASPSPQGLPPQPTVLKPNARELEQQTP